MPEPLNISFLMKIVSDRAETLFLRELGSGMVTAAQCRVLMYLESKGGQPVSQRDLERYLAVSHTTVKGLLQRLEEKGLVRTAFDDSTDGRVKHAYLTKEFHRRHLEARDALRGMEERMLEGLSAQQREAMRSMLMTIFNNIVA